ncbi:hypothetical protein LPB3_06510 [Polaribacter vadi]|uniref:Uncharacterized protein n=1 Tax=Polaribacter vadi TaxID=1774273 RepID=A0A1B8TX29_9FLAO|nr:hypothetical protein LPB3_06510 [Polaribacter vadi]
MPWNIKNIISIPIIFWSLKTTNAFEFFLKFFNKQKVIVLTFTIFLPLANNLASFYDNLLSFHFFTTDLKYYNIFISEELKEDLHEYIEIFYRFKNGKT